MYSSQIVAEHRPVCVLRPTAQISLGLLFTAPPPHGACVQSSRSPTFRLTVLILEHTSKPTHGRHDQIESSAKVFLCVMVFAEQFKVTTPSLRSPKCQSNLRKTIRMSKLKRLFTFRVLTSMMSGKLSLVSRVVTGEADITSETLEDFAGNVGNVAFRQGPDRKRRVLQVTLRTMMMSALHQNPLPEPSGAA